jgi:hypothetical protein
MRFMNPSTEPGQITPSALALRYVKFAAATKPGMTVGLDPRSFQYRRLFRSLFDRDQKVFLQLTHAASRYEQPRGKHRMHGSVFLPSLPMKRSRRPRDRHCDARAPRRVGQCPELSLCAQRGDGATNCGFSTYEQCMAASRWCDRNPMFQPSAPGARSRGSPSGPHRRLIPRLQRQRRRRRRRRRIAVLARDLILVEVVKGTGFAGMKAIIVGGGSAALLRR